jgi:hypothetical protein
MRHAARAAVKQIQLAPGNRAGAFKPAAEALEARKHKGGPAVHILTFGRVARASERRETLFSRLQTLIASVTLQQCAICRQSWWIGICPGCAQDAFD